MTVSVVEDSVPPIVRHRGRASADMPDGAQERPGEGWEASAAESEADILSPLAIDNAVAVDDSDPPETRSRARVSDEVDDSDGAHKRPGRGWDDGVDGAAPNILRPLAVDNAIVADDGDPPETRSRARISDEVFDSGGAHKRPGRGWD
jgi:hypothetical protein